MWTKNHFILFELLTTIVSSIWIDSRDGCNSTSLININDRLSNKTLYTYKFSNEINNFVNIEYITTKLCDCKVYHTIFDENCNP